MDKQQLARENREFAETFAALSAALRPVQTTELSADNLDSFVEGREREALDLAEALENGRILVAADRQKAQARLTEISDELAAAHRLQQNTKR